MTSVQHSGDSPCLILNHKSNHWGSECLASFSTPSSCLVWWCLVLLQGRCQWTVPEHWREHWKILKAPNEIKSDDLRYLHLALPRVIRQAGLFLIHINPASLLIKHSSTNEKNKALKLALPYLGLAGERRESNFLSPPPAYTYSLNCK